MIFNKLFLLIIVPLNLFCTAYSDDCAYIKHDGCLNPCMESGSRQPIRDVECGVITYHICCYPVRQEVQNSRQKWFRAVTKVAGDLSRPCTKQVLCELSCKDGLEGSVRSDYPQVIDGDSNANQEYVDAYKQGENFGCYGYKGEDYNDASCKKDCYVTYGMSCEEDIESKKWIQRVKVKAFKYFAGSLHKLGMATFDAWWTVQDSVDNSTKMLKSAGNVAKAAAKYLLDRTSKLIVNFNITIQIPIQINIHINSNKSEEERRRRDLSNQDREKWQKFLILYNKTDPGITQLYEYFDFEQITEFQTYINETIHTFNFEENIQEPDVPNCDLNYLIGQVTTTPTRLTSSNEPTALGAPGLPDSDGLICPKGQKGERGPTGDKGDPGESGNDGLPGKDCYSCFSEVASRPGSLVGPPGLPGLPGPIGQKGELGMRGERGYVGLPGMPGLPCEKVEKRLPGHPGPRGKEGFPGPGLTCSPGNDGLPGGRGRRGPPGRPIGTEGDKGDAGLLALPGLERPSGFPSFPGVKGEKGDSCLTCIPGSKGEKGDRGYNGLLGIQGPQGPPNAPTAFTAITKPNYFHDQFQQNEVKIEKVIEKTYGDEEKTDKASDNQTFWEKPSGFSTMSALLIFIALIILSGYIVYLHIRINRLETVIKIRKESRNINEMTQFTGE